jgi:hypothetical protein
LGSTRYWARSVQRAFTVYGDADQARRRQSELVQELGVSRLLFSGEAAPYDAVGAAGALGRGAAPLEAGDNRLPYLGSAGSVV